MQIIRPSFANYRRWFIRDPRIVVPVVVLLLFQIWIAVGRSFAGVLVVVTPVTAVALLLLVVFFLRARVTVDGERLSYRGLALTRSIALGDIDATYLELTAGSLSVNRSRAVLLISTRQGKKFKRLSEGFWSEESLRKLAGSIGAARVSPSSAQGREIAANQGPLLR